MGADYNSNIAKGAEQFKQLTAATKTYVLGEFFLGMCTVKARCYAMWVMATFHAKLSTARGFCRAACRCDYLHANAALYASACYSNMEHRLVVRPPWQGFGLGSCLSDEIGCEHSIVPCLN